MKPIYLAIILISFSTSVFSAPSFNAIFDSVSTEQISEADKEYDEAELLSDRANLPTKEMLERALKSMHLYKHSF
jgi:hypothetical protein